MTKPDTPQRIVAAAVQMPRTPSRKRNLHTACELVEEAAFKLRARLVVLPEAFADYWRGDNPEAAEPVPGPSTERLLELSSFYHIVVVAPLIERREDVEGFSNSAAVIDDGHLVAVVRKTHLHTSHDPTGHEPDLFVPGDELEPVDTSAGRIGVMICHDGAFVEVPRVLVLKGAQVLAWPMSSSTHRGYKERFHAEMNVVPVVTSSIAHPGGHGNSSVVDDRGEVLALARGETQTVAASIDLHRPAHARAQGIGREGVIRLRRPELYGVLTDRC